MASADEVIARIFASTDSDYCEMILISFVYE